MRERPQCHRGTAPGAGELSRRTGDSQLGDNGEFAPGRSWSLAAIEARDGLSYTAAFSERLVGSGGEGPEDLASYRIAPSPLPTGGCPTPSGTSGLRDDAGSSWIASDYRSTLYNHALPPNGRPSCIADDGRTAYIGVSSGHVRGVNLLRLDGSVSVIVPTIAPKVWRELAAISEAQRDGTPLNKKATSFHGSYLSFPLRFDRCGSRS